MTLAVPGIGSVALLVLFAAVGTRSLAVPSSSPAGTRSVAVPSSSPLPTYALHEAAAAGDTSAVDLLLFAGLSSEERNAKASTPLHLAALHGHEAVARVLLDRGAAANALNEDGMTPLHAAVSARQLQVAQLLLSRGADVEATSNAGLRPVRIAARKGDAAMLSVLLEAGAEVDEESVQFAFWVAVAAVESTAEDEALSTDVPRLLHHIFDADFRLLLQRDKLTTNVTCLQPAEEGIAGVAEGLKYVMDDAAHADLPLREGRRCEGGSCCDACSRITFPSFAVPAETDFETFPQLENFNFNDVRWSSTGTILVFVRLIERVRRAIAHEYGLPLSTILPLQAYSRKYSAGLKQKGGGGGEGDSVILHTDEATHSSYHYSCVLYLSTQHEDFEGGSFLWNDRNETEDGTKGRVITPFSPTRGAAVIFSSGWENMHEVEQLISGTRFAVPCFFTTCPVPQAAYDGCGGVPSDDEAIADDLQHLLLDKKSETPSASAGRVKELLMKWHMLLAPEHG